MALLDALIPTFTADVVSVLDGIGGQPVFRNARPIKAILSEPAKLMTHPLESGANIVDHRVILPISASVSFIVEAENYRDTYQEIRTASRESTRLSLQTKTDTYRNLYLQDIPHEEDPAFFDTITIVLELVEALIANVQIQELPQTEVSDAQDASSVDRGEVTGTDVDSGSAAFQALSRNFG